MQDDTTVKKEATIQDLSDEMGHLLSQFKGSLDDRFRRNPLSCDEEKSPEKPMQPHNVLDEIIEQMRRNIGKIKDIIDFTDHNVFPKIS